MQLRKALYGLRESPALWYRCLRKYLSLTALGFHQSVTDPCIFWRVVDGKRQHVMVFVDDLLIAADTDALNQQFVAELQQRFTITVADSNEPRYLGLEIQHDADKRILTVCQRSYIEEQAQRFGIETFPVYTPFDPKESFVTTDDSPQPGDKEHVAEMANGKADEFKQIVGACNWVACSTHPEAAVAVSELAQVLTRPGRKHWRMARHLLQYLYTVRCYGIVFAPDASYLSAHDTHHSLRDVVTYADSNHDDAHPRVGSCIMIGGGVVAWDTKRLRATLTGTAQAECFTMRARLPVWKRDLWLTLPAR